MTARGGFLNSAEPGQGTNRAPRAPTYSRLSGSQRPMCESNPASSEVCNGTKSPSSAARSVAASGSVTTGRPEGLIPSDRDTERSWLCSSCHSRTRR